MLDAKHEARANAVAGAEEDEGRRRATQLDVGEAFSLTLLTQASVPIRGVVENSSASGFRLVTSSPLAPRSPIRLQTQGIMLLGEVIYCEPASEEYAVGVSLEHSLDVVALARQLDSRWLASE